MSNLIPGNQKHLTLEDRLYIESSLDEGKTFKDIANFLCKDPTTISKEVRLHRVTNTWNLPAPNAIRYAKNFRKNNAVGLIKHHMSAMGVQKHETNAPSHINIPMMHTLQNVNTKNCVHHPEKV